MLHVSFSQRLLGLFAAGPRYFIILVVLISLGLGSVIPAGATKTYEAPATILACPPPVQLVTNSIMTGPFGGGTPPNWSKSTNSGTPTWQYWIANAIMDGTYVIAENNIADNDKLFQNLTGLGSLGNIVILSLDLAAQEGHALGGGVNAATATLDIYLGGIKYATITNNDNPTSNNNISIQTFSGAMVDPSDPFTLTSTGPTGYAWDPDGFTLLIPYTGPNTAELAFVHNADGEVQADGSDDFALDNISIFGPICRGIAGTIYHDTIPNGVVDGTGTNLGGLFANLINTNTGLVVTTVSVNADGTYMFNDILPGTYRVQVNMNAGTAGSAPPAQTLPSEWLNTGDAIAGVQGNVADGEGEIFILATSNMMQVDFGVDNEPAAAALAGFEASSQGDHVVVVWETVFETTTASFNLYRSTSLDGDRTLLTSRSATGGGMGAVYTYTDTDVQSGQTYFYELQDVDVNGDTHTYEPVSVVYQAPTAVTLSTLVADGGNGNFVLPVVLALILSGALLMWRRFAPR